MDPERTNPASGSEYVQHGYSPWAPQGLGGNTSQAGVASLGFGVAALLLAAFSVLPFAAWLTAQLDVVVGSTLLSPPVTTARKVTSGVGIVSAVAAMGLLLR